jgi:S-adenosylmethionine:tRNA ribosyltransferase-isomerase
LAALDKERYQTVYASREGAVAAPTAGLHFTPVLLEAIRSKGVRVVPITLHVGLGTFQPIRAEEVEGHRLHAESFQVSQEGAEAINRAVDEGGRVVAVGTTVTRTLETAASEDGRVASGSGETETYIYPGYKFKVVKGLITNFHLPKSTLLALAVAFGGYDLVMRAYSEAVEQRYRFYSYGDAMLIV